MNPITQAVEALEAVGRALNVRDRYVTRKELDELQEGAAAALADLRRYEVVEGEVSSLGSHREFWPNKPWPSGDPTQPAILLVERKP